MTVITPMWCGNDIPTQRVELPLSEDEKKKYLEILTKEDGCLNEKNLKEMKRFGYPPRGTVIESIFVWYAKVDDAEITLRQIARATQDTSGKIIKLVYSK